nr:unnamed protein product [Spirometra erinaceieuropaei]
MEAGESSLAWTERSTQYQHGADGMPTDLEDLRQTIRIIAEEVHEQSQDLTHLLQKTLLSGRNKSLASQNKSMRAEDTTMKEFEEAHQAVPALTDPDPEASKKSVRMSLPEALEAIQNTVESFARGGQEDHAELTFTLGQFPADRQTEPKAQQLNSEIKSALGAISSMPMSRAADLDGTSGFGSQKAAVTNLPSSNAVSELHKVCSNLPEALETMRESIELLAQAVHRDNAELTRLIRMSMNSPGQGRADTGLTVGSNLTSPPPATGDLHEIQLGLRELDEEIHRQNRQMKSILMQALEVQPEMIAAAEERDEVLLPRGGFLNEGATLRKENRPFASSSQSKRKKGSRADESSLLEFKTSGKARDDFLLDDIGGGGGAGAGPHFQMDNTERTSIASLPPLTVPEVMEPLKNLRASVRQLEADLKADRRGANLSRTIDAIKASAESIRSEMETMQPPPVPSKKIATTDQQNLPASDPLVQAVLEMIKQVVKARRAAAKEADGAEAMKVLAEIRKCMQSSQSGFPASTNNGVLSNLGGYEGIRLVVQMVKDARAQGL